MWKGIRELVDLILLWGFWYVGSFMIMVVAIVYFIQSNQPPIIKQYHTHNTVQVVEPPKKVFVEEEICTRIDGCRIIDNVCVDCIWGKE
ncbi:MAG TPA: hypothetical protein EYG61_04915 [Deltaproteobacteria bacterium]|nr:hypothetical protein [Deltaproteobacteria bacterium]